MPELKSISDYYLYIRDQEDYKRYTSGYVLGRMIQTEYFRAYTDEGTK